MTRTTDQKLVDRVPCEGSEGCEQLVDRDGFRLCAEHMKEAWDGMEEAENTPPSRRPRRRDGN